MTAERLSLDLIDLGPPPTRIVRRLLTAFARWRDRERQRSALARLPAYLLRDMGLGEADVWRETRVTRWLE